MLHKSQSTAAYAPVVDLDCNAEIVDSIVHHSVTSTHRRTILHLSLALCAIVLCVGLGFGSGILVKQKVDFESLALRPCMDPVIRREWRDLNDAEKGEYIAAVQCLRRSPSRLGLNQTLYDDFPYVHSRNGEACE